MGLVLVFDMDQTILDSSDPYLFNRPPTPSARVILKRKIRQSLNMNVLNILRRAAKLRPTKVEAILLLTNNSSTILVSAVDEVLYELTSHSRGRYTTFRNEGLPDKPYFFDSIMMRGSPSRPKTIDDNPPKRFIDVATMLNKEPSMKDIYFFDDIGNHTLRSEFDTISKGIYSDHYIQITPPYTKGQEDRTNYDPILRALSKLDGRDPVLKGSSRRRMTKKNRCGFRV